MIFRWICGFLAAVLLITTSAPPIQASVDWGKEKRRPIRGLECQVYLLPDDALPGEDPDSMGILMATSHSADEFVLNLREVLSTQGPQALAGAELYVTGVDMGRKSERDTQEKYRGLLESAGVRGVKVRVLSVPKAYVEGLVAQLENAWQKFVYFFPSLKRDAQRPLLQEWVSGAVGTVLIEAPTVVYLVNRSLHGSLPGLDAGLVIGTHLITLGIYTLYSKSMTNWLFRNYRENPQSFLRQLRAALAGWAQWRSTQGASPALFKRLASKLRESADPNAPQSALLFSKQMLLAFPFVVNYSVLGRFTEIRQFVSTHALSDSIPPVLAEVSHFIATQSLTLVLQTLFYKSVITQGIDLWMNRQEGTENVTAARVVKNIARFPVLAFDAVFVAMATHLGGAPVFSAGPFEVTWGQLGIAGLLAGGSRLKDHPEVLDRLLAWYKSVVPGGPKPDLAADSRRLEAGVTEGLEQSEAALDALIEGR